MVARKPPTSAQSSRKPQNEQKTRATSPRSPRDATAARKARVAEIRQTQKSRERRTVLVIVAACAVLVLVLGGVITYGILDAQKNQPDNQILSMGVPAASASCDDVTTDPASGNSDHVGPGTNRTDVKQIQYSTVPPTSGSHFVQPVLDGRQFYSQSDTPAVETLVHNLEHGYTVLWYVPSEANNDQLKQVATLANKLAPSQSKFIVAPWNEAYGKLPDGKKYALSHWSATTDAQGSVQSQNGHRQLCGSLSGEVVKTFVTRYPRTDAPEPNGA